MTNMGPSLFLCAAGNPEGVRLAIEINQAHQRWYRIVLVDDDPAKQGTEILGLPVIGPFEALADHHPGDQAVNLVARSTAGRDKARARIEGYGLELVSLVHPSIDLRFAQVGQAVTIYAGCTISAMSQVGDHSVIFTQAVLGHGANLGNGAVLAPGAVVNARVQVGEQAYIGSNASVLPDLKIGANATVSACSAAIGDVPPGCVALGVPAEIIGGVTAPPDTTAPSLIQGDVHSWANEISAVFARVLGMPDFPNVLGFFDAGGNSKQVLEAQAALSRTLGVNVSVTDVFRFSEPEKLAAFLMGGNGATISANRAALRRSKRRKKRDKRRC